MNTKRASHLELIMSHDSTLLSDEQARELFGRLLDDELDEHLRTRLERTLQKRPTLRDELDELEATLAFLHTQPRPVPANDLVARINAAVRVDEQSAPDNVVPLAPRRQKAVVYALEAAVGIAAVVALVVGFTLGPRFAQDDDGAVHGVGAAGAFADVSAASTTLAAPGLDPTRVVELATERGLERHGDALVFVGDDRAVAQFVLQLRLEMASRGGEVSGMVPSGERIQVTVNVH